MAGTGRYVRIQSGSDRALSLAEVEIYACGVPTAANITANPLGENQYELKGYVIPNGATINSITVEHGTSDFSNSNPIDIIDIGLADTFYINTIVDIGAATDYQFRIKYDTPTKSYTTNDFIFLVNTDYCTPVIENRVWFKTFREITFNNLDFEGNGDSYDDQTAYSFGEFLMGDSYPISLTTPSPDWHNLTFLVYADLNNDGDFTDYNEIIGASPPNGHTTTFNVIIPTEDVLVDHDLRMRILGHEGGAFTTCFSPVGNFKDFTIRIKGGACTGTGHLVPFYRDMDNDGFGDETMEITRNCTTTSVAGYVSNNQDFDDNNNVRYPNALELCDNIDNDGDNEVDEPIDFNSESLLFTNETVPSETYTASTTIETNQAVTVMENTDVHLIAGQTIILKEGFSVAAGAEFHAQIAEDCAATPLSNEIVATARTSNIPSSIKENLTMRVYPNPFRLQVTLDFYLPKATEISLQIYGMNGELMTTILEQQSHAAGKFKVDFAAKNYRNGMYYVVLTTADEVLTDKVIVLR